MIEPVIQGIVGLIKGIVSVTITVVNAIIGTLNKLSFTVPDWVPALGGKQFGFNLKEVAMPAFANGGFTHGVSIAGEAEQRRLSASSLVLTIATSKTGCVQAGCWECLARMQLVRRVYGILQTAVSPTEARKNWTT